MNHYVANPFTIHQRLYIYIFISPATISHTVLPVLPEEKTIPDDSTDSHTERTLTHRITYRGTCLSFLQRMYDTPYDCTDLRLSKFSLRSFFQCSHARSFFHVDFPDTIRYDNDRSLYRDGKLYRIVSSSTRAFSPYRLLDYREIPITLNRFVLLRSLILSSPSFIFASSHYGVAIEVCITILV